MRGICEIISSSSTTYSQGLSSYLRALFTSEALENDLGVSIDAEVHVRRGIAIEGSGIALPPRCGSQGYVKRTANGLHDQAGNCYWVKAKEKGELGSM